MNAPTSAGVKSSRPTVLLVDDDSVVLGCLHDLLGMQSLQVEKADCGGAALAFCARQPPDAVLLDLGLPDIDGQEVLRRLKSDPVTAGIPVLALTARDDPEEVGKAFALGAADYVTKPFSGTVVLARLQAVLRTRRLLEQLTQARAAAEESAQLKSRFLASMSHEMRTPLHGVTATSDLLLGTPLTPDQAALAHTIKLSGERLLLVIQSALDLLNLEAGKLQLENLPLDLHRLLEDTLACWRGVAAERNLELSLRVAPGLPARFLGDQGRLRLVFHHLLNAALKVASAGRILLEIEAVHPPNAAAQAATLDRRLWQVQAAIRVATAYDAARQKPELWLQSAATDTAEADVGLACAQQLVLFMGGTLRAQAEGERALACHCTLPLTAAPADDATGAPEAAGTPQPAAGAADHPFAYERDLCARVPARILLVDDDAINRRIGARMFQKLGYTIDLAADATEAINALRQTPYDLVFTDILMPGLSGTEAARLYREAVATAAGPGAPPLTIVAMTANALGTDRTLYLEAGMDDYIGKPVRPGTIQEFMRAWGRQRKDPAANRAPSADGSAVGATAPPGHDRASPPSPAEEPPIDTVRLDEMTGGDMVLLRETVGIFLSDASRRLGELSLAIDQQDAQAVRMLAHSLVGATATMGATTILAPLRALEQRAKQASLDDAPRLLAEAERQFDRITEHFQRLLAEPPATADDLGSSVVTQV